MCECDKYMVILLLASPDCNNCHMLSLNSGTCQCVSCQFCVRSSSIQSGIKKERDPQAGLKLLGLLWYDQSVDNVIQLERTLSIVLSKVALKAATKCV
jgi:hypothetical protein